jgi:hypothetical protein
MRKKMSFDVIREIAAAIPGVQESTSYGAPSLKLDGKLVACVAINKSAEPNTLGITIDPERRADLIAEAPDTYYVTDHYVNYPIVLVRLSRVNRDVLRDLLQMACRFVKSQKRLSLK